MRIPTSKPYVFLIASLLVLATNTISAETHGAWNLKRSTDPMTDTKIITAHTVASTTKSSLGKPQVLFIRCSSDDLEIFINWNQFVTSVSGALKLRFDKRPAQEVAFNPSTDYKATFLEEKGNELTFLEIVTAGRKYNTLLAEVYPYGENPALAKFSLSGFSQTASKAAAECGYSSDYEGEW